MEQRRTKLAPLLFILIILIGLGILDRWAARIPKTRISQFEGDRDDPVGKPKADLFILGSSTGMWLRNKVFLGEAGIKTLDDLADLAADELSHKQDGLLREFGLNDEEANAIIMAARAHWFDDDEDSEAEDAAAAEDMAAAGDEAGAEIAEI